ncbi:hypothetical protein NC99_37210 [Sunxiuqinia dokdonensis]|uniref:Uncharacterized protein n=1 Tax=Sunxiuqinia dokdonensis TaxID=1409788 RepID=A0A0L8V5E5_9BACT|nr:hypothetical protein NC99_37210 [Sunxiuqinia dokdonensis]
MTIFESSWIARMSLPANELIWNKNVLFIEIKGSENLSFSEK